MARSNLSLYLNDHLAGSVAALELLDRMLARVRDPALAVEIEHLSSEIEQDQSILRALMARLRVGEDRWRKVGARVVQKLASLKLRLFHSERGELQLLHALDALSAGVQAKRSLWTALATAAPDEPRLASTPFDDLIGRVDEQQAILAGLREPVARRALGASERRSTA